MKIELNQLITICLTAFAIIMLVLAMQVENLHFQTLAGCIDKTNQALECAAALK